MSRSPNPGITIFLYICGIALILTAILVVVKGSGVLPAIPDYVIWALVLISVGAGILAGLKNLR